MTEQKTMTILIACRRQDEFERIVFQLRFHFTEIRGPHDPSDYLDFFTGTYPCRLHLRPDNSQACRATPVSLKVNKATGR